MFCIRRPDAIKRTVLPNAVKICGAFSCLLFVSFVPANAQVTVYQTNFDSLVTGTTLPSPGRAGQDGFFTQTQFGTAFGEIQSTVANGGKAIHQFSPSTVGTGGQSESARLLSINLSNLTRLQLDFDFYAASSDLTKVNPYTGSVQLVGVGFEGLAAGVFSGNGPAKNVAGVNVGLNTFNGVDNNGPVQPLTVGQRLTWNAWHSVSVAINPQTNRYISLTVDGSTQNLSNFFAPYGFGGPTPFRGTLVDKLIVSEVANNTTFAGNATNDDFYVDNIRVSQISAAAALEPGTLALLVPGLVMGAGIVRRRSHRK